VVVTGAFLQSALCCIAVYHSRHVPAPCASRLWESEGLPPSR
jgi:hypothetical protein